MSRKTKHSDEKNPLSMVLYIAVVLILLACIWGLLCFSRQRRQTYAEKVREAAENETEYVMTERVRETESESETSSKSKGASAGGKSTAADSRTTKDDVLETVPDAKQDDAGESEDTETQDTEEAENSGDNDDDESAESENESAGEDDTENTDAQSGIAAAGYKLTASEKAQTILVLNGTRRPGVAGYWSEQLKELGYRNVFSASYNGEIQDNTVLYTSPNVKVTGLQLEFEGSETREGAVEEGIEPVEGETLPERISVYVVIGRDDVVTETE